MPENFYISIYYDISVQNIEALIFFAVFFGENFSVVRIGLEEIVGIVVDEADAVE